jgi:hypothetical protein
MDPQGQIQQNRAQYEATMARIAEDARQFNEQMAKLWLPTLNDITRPGAVSGLTGELMDRPDLYGDVSGRATFGSLAGTAGMFGFVGDDPRMQRLGYESGTETLGGRAQASSEARSDTEMSMEYGGAPIIGGKPAPPWMAPHAAFAQEWARKNGGQAPSQEQLNQGINDAVMGALAGLRENAEYKAADRARRVQMEAQQVAGAIGMTPQNAANLVTDLRTYTDQTGKQSTALEIVDSVARWQNPDDPALAVNQAMTRLRTDPAYQAAPPEQKYQMEGQRVSAAVGMPLENALAAVKEMRSGTSVSGGLSGNEAVTRAISRNMPPGSTLSGTGQQGPAAYGQAGATSGMGLQAQVLRRGGPTASGGPVMMQEDYRSQYGAPPMDYQRAAGNSGMTPLTPQQMAADAANIAEANADPSARFTTQSMGGPAPLAGVQFGGTNATQNGQAMSPAQRQLAEQARQADLQAQIGLRGQDLQNALTSNQQRIAETEMILRDAIERGDLALRDRTEANLNRLNQEKLALERGQSVGRVDGEETLEARNTRVAAEQAAQKIQMEREALYGGSGPQFGGASGQGGETLAGRTQREAEERARLEMYGGSNYANSGTTLAARNSEADIALRAAQQAASMRADPFALEVYRRGLSSSGVPNIINAVGGRGQLPASAGGVGGAPAAMSLQGAATPVTGPQFGAMGAPQPGMMHAAVMPQNGPPSAAGAAAYARAAYGPGDGGPAGPVQMGRMIDDTAGMTAEQIRARNVGAGGYQAAPGPGEFKQFTQMDPAQAAQMRAQAASGGMRLPPRAPNANGEVLESAGRLNYQTAGAGQGGPTPQQMALEQQHAQRNAGQMTQHQMGAPAPQQAPGIASLEQQAGALGTLKKMSGKAYASLDPSGKRYVNSGFKFAGEAADDDDIEHAARKALPQFARRGVPTFGRLAA